VTERVARKVPVTTVERVPVTVCRTVREEVTVKVPYTVTRLVPVTEVKRVPVTVRRNALGAYAAAASLRGPAAEAAKAGAAVVSGGEAALAPGCATYDTDAADRVFVEGARVQKTVTYHVTRQVPAVEVRRVPYTVTRQVPVECVKPVPMTVTKMVPTVVTKVVPVTTCKVVTQEVVRHVPTRVTVVKAETVTKCVPVVVTKDVPYTCKVRVPCTAPVPAACGACGPCGATPAAESPCGAAHRPRYVPACPPCGPCGSSNPPCGSAGSPCGTAALACGPCAGGGHHCRCAPCACGVGCGMRYWLTDTNRDKRLRDFFHRVCAGRLACDPCPPPAACPGPCR
jgi:hypothetical protein